MNDAPLAISVSELDDLIENHEELVLADVRESEEYARGRIPGALAVPIGTLGHATDSESVACNPRLARARGATVVVYCDDGRRGRLAAERLARLGYRTVYYLGGGLRAWKNEGFALVSC